MTEASPPAAVEVSLQQFQQYLRQERSLTEAPVINYTPVARLFLLERFREEAVDFHQITAGDVTAFVQRQASLITSKRAPLVVTALRSFLRYLFHSGIVATDSHEVLIMPPVGKIPCRFRATRLTL